ncbi:TfoX/Sxy family protein [Nocardiopsis sp. FIRDI 009]|uniref:TfoX/Sxy family protein n=1 Tax=Nocardiopsis sp. FIRDI 009 TaxID=714197 RepID=UPI0018E551CA|nr:TfoX/Sxy family protein [Nocardiopsis sp. FIRDI 009]
MSVARLRNLGPASARMLATVGVRTAADLEALGAAEVYRRLRETGAPGLSRNLLWAMEGALLDVDWRNLPPEIRTRLLAEAGEA